MTNIKTSTYLLLLQIWWVRTTRATDWRPLARDPPTPVHAALLGCQWLIFDILIISFLLGCQWLTKACALFKRRHILVQIENRGCVGETVFHVCFLQGLRLFDKNILCQHHHSSSKAPRSTSTWPRGCSSTSRSCSTTSTSLTSERRCMESENTKMSLTADTTVRMCCTWAVWPRTPPLSSGYSTLEPTLTGAGKMLVWFTLLKTKNNQGR